MTTVKKANPSTKSTLEWVLDHAMIIIIILLGIYTAFRTNGGFVKIPNLLNLLKLTAARLPMALGVAGCIVLAGTDLSGGRMVGLTGFIAAIVIGAIGGGISPVLAILAVITRFVLGLLMRGFWG